MGSAWYSTLQDQLHEDLQRSSGIGEESEGVQTENGNHALVPEQSIDLVDDLNV